MPIPLSIAAAMVLVQVATPPRGEAAAVDSRAVRCAATNAVLAAMLESGSEPGTAADDADREGAAMFRSRSQDWLTRIGKAADDAGIRREAAELARQVGESGSPAAAQSLLEARLGECGEPDRFSHS